MAQPEPLKGIEVRLPPRPPEVVPTPTGVGRSYERDLLEALTRIANVLERVEVHLAFIAENTLYSGLRR